MTAEYFNCASHLFGAVLAAAGLVPLLVLAVRAGDPWRITGVAVFGASLICLYGFSSAYHGLHGVPKAFFRKLDRTAIYVLIAGTWTPFALVEMRDPRGLGLLGLVWALAVFGIGVEFLRRDASRWVTIVLSLVMGWLAVFAIGPLARALPTPGLVALVAGGLLYTAGVVFYVLDRRLSFGHGVFHVLVLGGSIAHYLVVLLYVA